MNRFKQLMDDLRNLEKQAGAEDFGGLVSKPIDGIEKQSENKYLFPYSSEPERPGEVWE